MLVKSIFNHAQKLLSGQHYTIKIFQFVLAAGAEREVTSDPITGVFTTKPLPPRDFKVEDDKIVFTKSQTLTIWFENFIFKTKIYFSFSVAISSSTKALMKVLKQKRYSFLMMLMTQKVQLSV